MARPRRDLAAAEMGEATEKTEEDELELQRADAVYTSLAALRQSKHHLEEQCSKVSRGLVAVPVTFQSADISGARTAASASKSLTTAGSSAVETSRAAEVHLSYRDPPTCTCAHLASPARHEEHKHEHIPLKAGSRREGRVQNRCCIYSKPCVSARGGICCSFHHK